VSNGKPSAEAQKLAGADAGKQPVQAPKASAATASTGRTSR
jgi:hypothetical protein